MILMRRTFAWLTLAVCAAPAWADDVQYEDGADGIRYQVITQTVQRPITETRYEARESTIQRERFTTDMQDSVRTYQVPVTQQQWVPGYQRTWNVFAPPVLSYRLMPVTRWETRTETVRIPVTRRDYVPEKVVQHVPVTNTKIAEEKIVRRVAVGHVGSGTNTANIARSDNSSSGGGSAPEEDQTREADANQHIDRRR